jgi:hypothetical protein
MDPFFIIILSLVCAPVAALGLWFVSRGARPKPNPRDAWRRSKLSRY